MHEAIFHIHARQALCLVLTGVQAHLLIKKETGLPVLPLLCRYVACHLNDQTNCTKNQAKDVVSYLEGGVKPATLPLDRNYATAP
jgi:hypothetical protein